MTINFPNSKEIQLENPPLDRVICQVRIPPILKINKEEPSKFQDIIRHRFPFLEIEHGVEIESSSGPIYSRPTPTVYRFLDEQSGTKNISLAMDFFAVVTSNYQHWENFIDDLNLANSAMQQVYEIDHAIRAGLRYINLFTLENTSSKSEQEISRLFRSELTALLDSEVGMNITNTASRFSFRDGGAQLNLLFRKDQGPDGPRFFLDMDYFEKGKIPLAELGDRYSRYHEKIYDCFRWCVTGESLERFQPVEETMR